jgi:hypothetical protein
LVELNPPQTFLPLVVVWKRWEMLYSIELYIYLPLPFWGGLVGYIVLLEIREIIFPCL